MNENDANTLQECRNEWTEANQDERDGMGASLEEWLFRSLAAITGAPWQSSTTVPGIVEEVSVTLPETFRRRTFRLEDLPTDNNKGERDLWGAAYFALLEEA